MVLTSEEQRRFGERELSEQLQRMFATVREGHPVFMVDGPRVLTLRQRGRGNQLPISAQEPMMGGERFALNEITIVRSANTDAMTISVFIAPLDLKLSSSFGPTPMLLSDFAQHFDGVHQWLGQFGAAFRKPEPLQVFAPAIVERKEWGTW